MKSRIVKGLIYLGDISFSIYIFHVFFIRIFIEYLGVDNVPVLMASTLVSTILFSGLTYKWIEKPFIDYSKSKEGLLYQYKLILNKKV